MRIVPTVCVRIVYGLNGQSGIPNMRSRVRYLTLFHGHTLLRIVFFALFLKRLPRVITPTLREALGWHRRPFLNGDGFPERLTITMNNNIVIFG